MQFVEFKNWKVKASTINKSKPCTRQNQINKVRTRTKKSLKHCWSEGKMLCECFNIYIVIPFADTTANLNSINIVKCENLHRMNL